MSLKTDNFKLYKYEDNDAGDLRFLHDSMDTIDNGLSPFYVATQSGANTYKVITGANKTTLANGYGIRVAIPSASDGAVSIIVDGCSAVPVKKANSNPVKNFKQNGVYSLTYYNSAFFLVSGGDESDTTTIGTDGSKVLEGETFIGSDGEIHTGTIPKRGDSTINLGINQTIELPAGYYTKVKATQNVTYHTGGWNPIQYGVYSDYFYERLDEAYYRSAETQIPIANVSRTLGFNENNVVGNVGGINGSALRYMTGTTTINNTDLTSAEYSIQLSQLNLPRTPKFVVCNWRITWYRREYSEEKTYTNSDYAFFDFVNSKCYYPTNTEWSHDSGGTYKIVDTIRKFTDHNLLRMHTESNNRSRIPTKGDDSSFRREPMIVDWFAVA